MYKFYTTLYSKHLHDSSSVYMRNVKFFSKIILSYINKKQVTCFIDCSFTGKTLQQPCITSLNNLKCFSPAVQVECQDTSREGIEFKNTICFNTIRE